MWHIRKVQAGYQSAPGPIPTKLDELHSKRPSVAVPTRRRPSRRGLAIETRTCLVSRTVGTCLLFGAGDHQQTFTSPGSSCSGGGSPHVPLAPQEHCLVPLKTCPGQQPSAPQGAHQYPWLLKTGSVLTGQFCNWRRESARAPCTSNKPSACRVYSLEPSRARARHWHVQSQSPEPGQSIPLSCFRTG